MEKTLTLTEVMALMGWSRKHARKAMQTMRCIQIGGGEQRKRWGVTEKELTRWRYENTVVPAEVKAKPRRRKRVPYTAPVRLEYRHTGR